jgi:hypothetical protein
LSPCPKSDAIAETLLGQPATAAGRSLQLRDATHRLLPRARRLRSRAVKRFSETGVTTTPGGLPEIQGATSFASSHSPTSGDRSSEHRRHNDGLTGIVIAAALSNSKTTCSQAGSKCRSRSARVNLRAYPAGSMGELPLCQAVAYTSATVTSAAAKRVGSGVVAGNNHRRNRLADPSRRGRAASADRTRSPSAPSSFAPP